MARREFEVRDIVEIYMHWQAGEGVRRIARSLGLDRNTVKKYISPALEAGFKPAELRTRGGMAYCPVRRNRNHLMASLSGIAMSAANQIQV